MRILRKAGVAVALMLIPGTLSADDHRADRFGGFSYGRGSSLFGVHYTDAITLPQLGDKLSVVYADLAAQFGSEDGSDVARFSYMTGLRLTMAKEPGTNGVYPKFLPFAQGLIGGVYNDRVQEGGNDFAVAVGAGFDYVLSRERPPQETTEVALRAQVDYFVKGGQDFPRFSFGVVIRSMKPHKPSASAKGLTVR